MEKNSIKDIQNKILEIMKFIDTVCRNNDIEYCIMGGTAIGAIRHGGFIPWDDDLDIFMTPENYNEFKLKFEELQSEKFIIQEWKTNKEYLEYAKVRMNGTTFIESNFKNKKNMHHGIYVDIMILHKCPKNKIIQKCMYYISKYVTLVGLTQRNWKPKGRLQQIISLIVTNLPNKFISKQCYKFIYKYRNLKENFDYCYFITKANFEQGIFSKDIFDELVNIKFEDTELLAPRKINEYLKIRYGNYMKLPSEEEQLLSVHAEIYDTTKGFEEYL